MLHGNRKFIVILIALAFSFILSVLAIIYIASDPMALVAVLGSIGAQLSIVITPFVVGNIQEHKAAVK